MIFTYKKSIFVLAMNKMSFDTFLAIGDVDTTKFDYVFVDNPCDLGDGGVKILGDFLMHPKADQILEKLNKALKYLDLQTSSVSFTGTCL